MSNGSKNKKLQEKAYLYLGQLLEQSPNEPEQAIDSYRRCIELNPNNLPALLHLGYLYLSVGKFENAVQVFEESLKARKNNKRGMQEAGCGRPNTAEFGRYRKVNDLNSLMGLADAQISLKGQMKKA